ncbi:MAG: clan AA aspartic protease [SAR202 cluster bacterium]|jgi:clan AA aspartic protease|nr:clan AA aspartic protease [SAR202 cluster bacterium]MDP6512282.1 clan AA aspartic protease [SAR202 cluster bacterium]MDP6713938.1 clan AA aspartic protease [SAR202 cluster bacterium]
MIIGDVTPDAEAVIRLEIRGLGENHEEIEAVIDTGFDGSISLPPSIIQELGLVWRGRGRALLADGSSIIYDRYEVSVVWDGEVRRATADEADTDPLVGMGLMKGYELRIQVFEGGIVTLDPVR